MSRMGLIRTGSFHGTRTSGAVSVPLVLMMCPWIWSLVSALCSASIQ